MAELTIKTEPEALTIRPTWGLRVAAYGLGALGVLFLVLTLLVLAADGFVPGLLPTLGFGIAFSAAAFGILFGRDIASRVRVDADGIHVTAQRGGGRALVPADTISEIICVASESIAMTTKHTSATPSHRVFARKKDGGVVELYGSTRPERAQQVASEARKLLSKAARPSDPSASTFSSVVTVTRREGETRFAWPAGLPVATAVFAWGIVVGIGLGSLFFAIVVGGAAFVAVVFVALMAGALAFKSVRDSGITQSVAIVGDELRIERHRGVEVLDSTRCPVGSVQAVDYTMRLDRVGSVLAVRTGTAKAAVANLEVASKADDLARIGSAIAGLATSTLWVPVERLTLADRIVLDQALEREIAARGPGRAVT